MTGGKILRRTRNATPLMGRHGGFCRIPMVAIFYLDKNQDPAAPRNNVDLAQAAFIIARDNPIGFQAQQPSGP